MSNRITPNRFQRVYSPVTFLLSLVHILVSSGSVIKAFSEIKYPRKKVIAGFNS